LFDLSEMRERVVRRAREVCFVIPRARALLSDRKDEILGAMAPDWDANQRALLMRQQLFFPDKRLLQYDCGKLQALAVLLARLYAEGHRVLIFTQMTRMLDILETFLAFHHYAYLRLDGSTRTEKRYEMMERFNEDRRIFCFILSTRSGGLGINLTGADTVIFYDSDWNPAMDAQAQVWRKEGEILSVVLFFFFLPKKDRAHRIGQTKTVHIYRLVSEKTVEENILKKALQKRQLEQLTLQEGEFSAAALAAMAAAKTVDVRELLGDDAPSSAMTLDARAWDEVRQKEDGCDCEFSRFGGLRCAGDARGGRGGGRGGGGARAGRGARRGGAAGHRAAGSARRGRRRRRGGGGGRGSSERRATAGRAHRGGAGPAAASGAARGGGLAAAAARAPRQEKERQERSRLRRARRALSQERVQTQLKKSNNKKELLYFLFMINGNQVETITSH
jgi:superfamily II DNA/RNA helicase